MDQEKIEFFEKLLKAYDPGNQPGIITRGKNDWENSRLLLSREEIELLGKRKPHVGEKSSRYVRKLLTTLKAVIDEREFAKFADAVNPMSYEGVIVLSADPVDYLLASNGNSWATCYYPNYDDGDYHGMYSGGTWSYMNDTCTLVEYSVTDIDADEIAWEGKINRQMVMYDIDHNRLAFSRLYPQCCDSGESEMYKTFRTFGQRLISELFSVPNYWRTFWYECHTQPDEFVTSDYYTGYNDLGYFRTAVCYNVNQCPEGMDFLKANREELFDDGESCEYGGPIYCPDCGDEFSGGGEVRYICDSCDCAQGRTCDCCGYRYDDDDMVYSNYDNQWLCYDCRFYDDYTDEYYNEQEHDFETVYGRYGDERHVDVAIEQAISNGDWFRCEHCGEVYDSNYCSPYEDDNGNVYCEDCFDKLFVTCDECGCIVERNDAVEYNGNYYCEDCAESVKADDNDCDSAEV